MNTANTDAATGEKRPLEQSHIDTDTVREFNALVRNWIALCRQFPDHLSTIEFLALFLEDMGPIVTRMPGRTELDKTVMDEAIALLEKIVRQHPDDAQVAATVERAKAAALPLLKARS